MKKLEFNVADREQQVLSTGESLKAFIESSLWQDLKREIEVWLCELRDNLEDPSCELSPGMLSRLQGSAMALRNVLQLPENMLDSKIEERRGVGNE